MKLKELKTRPSKNNPMLREVYYDNGGELPPQLTGLYTTAVEAQKDIDAYLRKRDIERPRKKSNIDGESSSK
jgi:hypothetical protein